MILQLHDGAAPNAVKNQLMHLLGKIPYGDVVEVEQELIAEGLPQEEILELCDIHSAVLKGSLDQTGVKVVPPGHPVDTFKKENHALEWQISTLRKLFESIKPIISDDDLRDTVNNIRSHIHSLCDVEKHYQRKENLLFPYLEKHGITGPPTVMWGKHDETRALLKAAVEALGQAKDIAPDELSGLIELSLAPAVDSVEEMIYKEENILFPMCLDTLDEEEWYHIYRQSVEIGFCLYDPTDKWQPEGVRVEESGTAAGKIQLPSGSFNISELTAILNTIPFDLTFVDKDDTVRFFTQGRERIFARNRAILGRKVQLCHPPSSVHIVQHILDDFHSGKQNHAAFWIEMKGRFISIEYFAMRGDNGEYLGTLEVSQDLTEKRALAGEQRLLNYVN
jgi:DUF438 domain-containing protein